MFDYDVIIIGTGPGGYVSAIRSAQLGLKTAVVEQAEVGGVCLNWGCIPTKALLKSAEIYDNVKKAKKFGVIVNDYNFDYSKVIKRSRQVANRLSKGVNYLFKKNDINLIVGSGKMLDNNTIEIINEKDTIKKTAKNIIIATGARTREFPNLQIDNEIIIGSRNALSDEEKPDSIVIIGGGAIGVEFAQFYNSFDTKVTIIEMLPNILPNEDEDISVELERNLKRSKIKLLTETKVEKIENSNGKAKVIYNQNGKSAEIISDKVLLAIGVEANLENIGLEKLGIEIENKWIKVNKNYQTNIENIFAIGDVKGAPLLAHSASAEGIIAVEFIANKNPKPLNYENIPACTFSNPQVASIGLTEKKAKEKYKNIKVGKVPFRAIGKAIAIDEPNGFAKIIIDADFKKIIGVHIIGPEASELLGGIGLAKSTEITADQIAETVFAHPTLSEIIKETAEDIFGEAIHI
ncbi:MAG: dihydrolipoyl dehydrogenase [Candidatus Marinimicrobia bacterium]|nr:dihydrolipoyl dehydrogenase [Candidatus Neomarinimicrobiota bacterium]